MTTIGYVDNVAMSPRRFYLERLVDHSGVSGTGVVAWGVIFPDDVVALHWVGKLRSTAIYDNIDMLMQIHGHSGSTHLEMLDR